MNSHDDVVHEILRGLGRNEATLAEVNNNLAYQREKVDEICRRLRAVETKTAVNSSIISLATSLIVENFKAIVGVFHGA